MTRTCPEAVELICASRLPGPLADEVAVALSVTLTSPVPIQADRSWSPAERVTDRESLALLLPKSRALGPVKSMAPAKAPRSALSELDGLTASGSMPAICAVTVPE